ncbi:Spy/CpxP family protein refolding chaperone [Bradyrhizobium sp. BR 1433]
MPSSPGGSTSCCRSVKDVRAALENFYATLSDEQKAQFEAIGPKRSA